MTTETATTHIATQGQKLRVRCTVETSGRVDLTADAERGVAAAVAAMAGRLTRPIAEMREEHRAALESDETDPAATDYGRLIGVLEGAAFAAATEGWHDPNGAWVTIDVESA